MVHLVVELALKLLTCPIKQTIFALQSVISEHDVFHSKYEPLKIDFSPSLNFSTNLMQTVFCG